MLNNIYRIPLIMELNFEILLRLSFFLLDSAACGISKEISAERNFLIIFVSSFALSLMSFEISHGALERVLHWAQEI